MEQMVLPPEHRRNLPDVSEASKVSKKQARKRIPWKKPVHSALILAPNVPGCLKKRSDSPQEAALASSVLEQSHRNEKIDLKRRP